MAWPKEEKLRRHREYDRKWRERNPEKARKLALERKHRARKRIGDYVEMYKRSHPCQCGEADLACLDFHHINGKDKGMSINHLKKHVASLERVKEETEKCEVVCVNCHRRIHWNDNKKCNLYDLSNVNYKSLGKREYSRRSKYNRRHIARKFVFDLKAKNSCKICGEKDPVCLEFHHKTDKKMLICQMAHRGHSIKKILAEITKCDILCANCHRKLHEHRRLR